MEGMEEKLNSILSNPQMMSQIMSMAQAFGNKQEEPNNEEPAYNHAPPPPAGNTSPLPSGFDPALLQKVVGIAQQTGVDRNQQSLLKALGPYLSKDRIIRLERAMRAAKVASIASNFFGTNGSLFFSGR